MAEVERGGGERWAGVAGLGRVRRRGTPIPVLPPRVPSPMPPPDTRVVRTEVSAAQRKELAVRMAEQLIKGEADRDRDPMKVWINPRILSKVNQSAVTGCEPPRYRPPPEPRYRERARSPPAAAPMEPRRARRSARSPLVLTTTNSPVPGEVFIDGPLSGLPPPSRRSVSQPPPEHPTNANAAARQASAAAAFFARAARLNLNASPARRVGAGRRSDDEGGSGGSVGTPTGGYSGALHRSPPPPPPALLRRLGTKEISGVGKVKVMLRQAGGPGADADATATAAASYLSVDKRRKQITLFDPATLSTGTPPPEDRRVGVAAPKMFAFDSVFTHEDSQAEVCSSALTDIIHAVINGSDGCLFCYGHAKLGKTQTMLGSPDSTASLGIIPSSISWLFRGISEQKQRTGARFSVRVSAVEISQNLKDLLAGHANECEQSPGVYLRDDPLQLQNHSELRAPSAEKAAYYLDSALAGRSPNTHFLYTLHVYQYSVATKGAVAGGRSRLHLIDLGSCERSKLTGGLSLSGLGNVLLGIFNGQKHIPHREHKLTQVLKECLSSLTCHVAMIAHVSPQPQHYSDTLGTVQLASRVHRIRRRRIKFPGGSPGAVAGEEGNRATSSENNPSSSEQSADTVIYVGPSDETDGEHPPVYLPSLTSGDNRCAMGKALRGSGAEARVRPGVSRSVPASPQRNSLELSGSGEDRASPHRVLGKPKPGLASSKSSPSRSVTKSKDSKPKVNGTHTPEERWIDGPKIPKSKVAEARNLHVMNKDGQHLVKKEMWVDGPSVAENGLSYGFMDMHKKNMIRKWVENQTVQMNKHKSPAKEKTPPRRYVTSFKTCQDEGSDVERACGVRGQASGQEDDDYEEAQAVDPLPQTSVLSRNGEISRVVPIKRLQTDDDEEEEDEHIEVEIIEVDEPAELVAMQDSCLQVTEEDIALCMGETENPLPEVDQEEHPLRILSEENLTVVSTFTDSLSIANDLERLFPRGPGYFHHTTWLQKQTMDVRANRVADNMNRPDRYQQQRMQPETSPFSRCQSLSLSDMLAQGELQNGVDCDNSSIVSEPAYCMGEDKKSAKFCLNCKGSLANGSLYDTSHFSHLTRSISSLRHPDGASNPNLQDVGERVRERGNGSECGRGLGEEDDDPRVPPPLQSSLLTLSREGFGCGKLKSGDSSGYVSGQPDSHSQSSIHDPGGPADTGEPSPSVRLRGWSESARLRELRHEQRILKAELAAAKSRLLIPHDRWAYERDARGGQLAELGRPGQFPGCAAARNCHPAQES